MGLATEMFYHFRDDIFIRNHDEKKVVELCYNGVSLLFYIERINIF